MRQSGPVLLKAVSAKYRSRLEAVKESNMDINLHIVAPLARREKVFSEIRRPVFSLLDKGPLAESCTYLSYDSLREVAAQKHLAHLSDRVLDEYAEEAE